MLYVQWRNSYGVVVELTPLEKAIDRDKNKIVDCFIDHFGSKFNDIIKKLDKVCI